MPPIDLYNQMILLAPSLMCGDLLNLGNQIIKLKQMGISYLHIDLADMHFVPNITLGFSLIEQVSSLGIPLDIHLMVEDPLLVVNKLKLMEKDIISFHMDSKSNVLKTIEMIKAKGCKVGLVLGPSVPILQLEPFIHLLDLIQVMCVQPGFSGQKFLPASYERVEELNCLIANSNIVIGVDGAIGYEQIKRFYSMGVRFFVLGSTILFNSHFGENLHQIHTFIDGLQAK